MSKHMCRNGEGCRCINNADGQPRTGLVMGGETWPLGREDAVPEISTQRRLTKSCWLQGDEAGTAGKRGDFAPSPPPPPPPHPPPSPKPQTALRQREVSSVWATKGPPSLLLGRNLFVPCRVEEATVLERVASPFSFRKRTPCLGPLIVAILTWHPSHDGPLSRVQSNETLQPRPPEPPSWKVAAKPNSMAKFPPNTWEPDKSRTDSFGAGRREGNSETGASVAAGRCWRWRRFQAGCSARRPSLISRVHITYGVGVCQ
ncbi:hypothetical protein B0T18DRAFT_215547 [Schizothecium vesticola]|uniref:Uncharacterized protein n=1 Tax=Schizothecium vesticola TaxID=314040 RepID=A0AA40EK30_9PEZI|nr:hypothetical protein B0T18DRAFT_215547 [Schizothecium vesticola]